MEPLRARATTGGSTASSRRSGARRTAPTSSSITCPRPRSPRAARPRPPPARATISFSSSRRPPPTSGQVIDHRDVVAEVEKRAREDDPARAAVHVQSEDRESTSRSRTPTSPTRATTGSTCGREVGFPNGPDTWDDLRVGGRRIKEKFGNPVGIGFSQEIDSNMALRALLWSFGGAEQDEQGRPTLISRRRRSRR